MQKSTFIFILRLLSLREHCDSCCLNSLRTGKGLTVCVPGKILTIFELLQNSIIIKARYNNLLTFMVNALNIRINRRIKTNMLKEHTRQRAPESRSSVWSVILPPLFRWPVIAPTFSIACLARVWPTLLSLLLAHSGDEGFGSRAECE